MNRWKMLGLTLSLGAFSLACGDSGGGGSSKCDEAAKILKDCKMEAEEGTACDADSEKAAQCVIDHPDGACSTVHSSQEAQDFNNCLFDAL
jgi:hypothetical protein